MRIRQVCTKLLMFWCEVHFGFLRPPNVKAANAKAVNAKTVNGQPHASESGFLLSIPHFFP